MRNISRTTLRELKKRYLNILKKCLLANLMTFGMVTLSTPAMAGEDRLALGYGETKEYNSSVTFEDIEYSGYGGAISNHGTITFGENSTATFTGNSAEYGGGAIDNYGTITFGGDATFTGNSAEYGVAIYNGCGANLIFNGDATFTDNSATGDYASGGAIYNVYYGTITFGADSSVSFSNNTANGQLNDIDNYGTINILGEVKSDIHLVSNRGTIGLKAKKTKNTDTDGKITYTGSYKLTDTTLDFSGDGIKEVTIENLTVGGSSALKWDAEIKDTGDSYSVASDIKNLTATGQFTTGTVNIMGGNKGEWYELKFTDLYNQPLIKNGAQINYVADGLYKTKNVTETGFSINFVDVTLPKTLGEVLRSTTASTLDFGDYVTVDEGETLNYVISEKDLQNGSMGELGSGEKIIIGATDKAEGTVINANGVHRIFDLARGDKLTLENLTIAGVKTSSFGGAIYNYNNFTGLVNLNNVAFTGNSASSYGGAIYNEGTITFGGDATFTGNSASDSGGAIFNDGTITFGGEATFTGNSASFYGGAIYNTDSNSKITFNDNFLFSGNTANRGADIYNSYSGTINFAQGEGKVGTLDGGIYQNNGTINKTGAGTLILGDEMENGYKSWNTSQFNQSAGLTIAHTDKLTFATTNTITGGELRVHGDSLAGLKASISSGAMLTYLTTNASEQVVGFEDISMCGGSMCGGSMCGGSMSLEGPILKLGAYTDEAKAEEIALAKVVDEDETSITTKLLTTDTIDRAKYNLSSDVSGATKVIFKDSDVTIASGTYNTPYDFENARIENANSITFNGNTSFKNSVESAGNGGAIDNSGTITFGGDTTFTGNSASSGGAIENYEGTITFNDNFLFSGNTANQGADIYNMEGTINFAQGEGKVGTLDGGIYQYYDSSKINKTGAGTLILGDEMKNSGSGIFTQSAGLTIARVDKLNFAKTNTITGGELRVHGDSLAGLKASVSSGAMLTYLTTNASEQVVGFEDSSMCGGSMCGGSMCGGEMSGDDISLEGAILTFGAYTDEAKNAELALVADKKVPKLDSNGEVEYDTNGDIVYVSYDAGSKLLTTGTIDRAKYNLTSDISGATKVIFKDSDIKLGASSYEGVYEIGESNTIDLRGDGVTEKTVSFSQLTGEGAKLSIDVLFNKETDGTVNMTADKFTLNGSTYEFSGVEMNMSGDDIIKATLDQMGNIDPTITHTATVLGGGATFKTGSTAMLTTASPYAYEVATSGQDLTVSASKLAEGVSALKYLTTYAGDSTLQMVDNGSTASEALDPLATGKKLILGASDKAKDSSIIGDGKDIFVLDKADTELRIKNLTITGAGTAIDNQAGKVTLENVILDASTGETAIINASEMLLKDVVVDKGINNTGSIVGEGTLALAGLSGAGTLTMNGATLDVADKFATSNKVVSNNMKIGDAVKEISFAELEIQEGTTLDIDNKHVSADKVTFGNESTLSVTLNELADYGTLSHDEVVGDENAKLNLKLTNGIDTELGIYQVFNKDNDLTLLDNNLLDIIDMGDGSYRVRKKADAILEADLGMSKAEVDTVGALLKEADEGANKNFLKAQEELLEGLQSENKGTVMKAKKALNALGARSTSVYQSQATAQFTQMHTVITQMLMNSTAPIFGHAGGEEPARATVYVKGLYDRVNSLAGDGFRMRSKGAVLGVQSAITEDLTVGVGYAGINSVAKEPLRRTEVDTNTGFISAQYQPNNWWVNGVVTYSRSQYDEEKNILSTKGIAKYDVDSLGAQITTGYNIKRGNWIVTPEVGVRYLNARQEGYTDSLGTTVEKTTSDFVTTMAGFKVGVDLGWMRPLAGVMVGYDVVTDDISAVNTLANKETYIIKGEALDRLSTTVVAGFAADIADNATLKLEYSGNYRKEYLDHSGMLRLEFRF